jgi:excisionase family DNA binding protein
VQKITGTMRQASEASGLSIRKLYDLIAKGKLRSVKVGRRRLMSCDRLRSFCLAGRAPIRARRRRGLRDKKHGRNR